MTIPLDADVLPFDAPNNKIVWSIEAGKSGAKLSPDGKSRIAPDLKSFKPGQYVEFAVIATVKDGLAKGYDTVARHKIQAYPDCNKVFASYDNLVVGQTYYFNLADFVYTKDGVSNFRGDGIINKELTDPTLHYKPFAYTRNKFMHTATFISDYNPIHSVTLDELDPRLNGSSLEEFTYGAHLYLDTPTGGVYSPEQKELFRGNV